MATYTMRVKLSEKYSLLLDAARDVVVAQRHAMHAPLPRVRTPDGTTRVDFTEVDATGDAQRRAIERLATLLNEIDPESREE